MTRRRADELLADLGRADGLFDVSDRLIWDVHALGDIRDLLEEQRAEEEEPSDA